MSQRATVSIRVNKSRLPAGAHSIILITDVQNATEARISFGGSEFEPWPVGHNEANIQLDHSMVIRVAARGTDLEPIYSVAHVTVQEPVIENTVLKGAEDIEVSEAPMPGLSVVSGKVTSPGRMRMSSADGDKEGRKGYGFRHPRSYAMIKGERIGPHELTHEIAERLRKEQGLFFAENIVSRWYLTDDFYWTGIKEQPSEASAE